MTGYVYILECNDGSYYTGSTNNIELRLWQHENGQGANYTRKHLPVKLVFVDCFERVDEAFAREKQIQGWSRKKKEALIQGAFNRLRELARCRNSSSSDFRPPGFDRAQPPGCSSSLSTCIERSRNEVEGPKSNKTKSRNPKLMAIIGTAIAVGAQLWL